MTEHVGLPLCIAVLAVASLFDGISLLGRGKYRFRRNACFLAAGSLFTVAATIYFWP